ncbi:MAG: hypothetical protein H7320_15950, partial [Ferruginibacter sp.]|nr:hypothetical protein [Ferruginibacter sp.]
IEDYHEEISYDPNGNIKTYLRNGDSRSLAMDKLDYKYIPNTNKLNYVTDFVTTATPADYRDIKNQSPNNYDYDSIGNLIRDNQEGISRIDWTVYGKIQQITKTSGSIIKYSYDAGGNRISKIAGGDSTYYVRDASGNVMSVYNKKNAYNLVQAELPVYGSSRLGVYNVAVDLQDCPPAVPAAMTIFTRGSKFFELSNHLGNVLATITDKHVQHSTDGTRMDYYTAEVNSASDYYPFGMQMPGRKGGVTGSGSYTPTTTTAPPPPTTAVADLVVYSRPTNSPAVYEATNSITFEVNFASTTGDIFEARILEQPATSPGGNTFGGGTWSDGEGGVYRYGFNGQEKSDDVTVGNTTAEYWEYDSRIGRRWNVEPLINKYPYLSSYVALANTPVNVKDPDGKDVIFVNGYRAGGMGTASNRDYDFQRKLQDDYWNSKNFTFISVISNYFGDFNTHFVSGDHRWGSDAADRIIEGKTVGIKMVSSGEIKVSKTNNIMTVVMHSQGNAEGVGIAEGIIEQAKKQGVDVTVNLVFLSVHQPGGINKKLSKELAARGIQFTYANDNSRVLQPMAKQQGSDAGLTGVADANATNKNWKKDGTAAHAATVDDPASFEAIQKLDSEKKIFVRKPTRSNP